MNPHHEISYLVGGLLATVSPEEETEKLNQCAEKGWELITVMPRKYKGHEYIFYYLRRKTDGESEEDAPRFDVSFFQS